MSMMSPTRTIGLLAAVVLLSSAGAAFAQSAKLEQCANGSASSPRPCTGSAWISGHITKKNGHYAEGDSVPFRLVMGGFQVGSTGHVLSLQWDTTDGGRHAYDYLTSYNRTESFNNNPCSGVPGCGVFTTILIPVDLNVTGGGVTPVFGLFTLFGATITSVSGYTVVGSFNSRSSTTIHVTFTADSTTPVLAWGGHLASTPDWGVNNSSSTIPGASFHMRAYALDGKNPGTGERGISGVVSPFDLP